MDDWALVRAYRQEGSEAAFEALVGRYVAMVRGVAARELRSTGDHGGAEDVTQAVFALLAEKAGTLPARTVIARWLFRAARYRAANVGGKSGSGGFMSGARGG